MSVNRSATIKIGEHTILNSYCEKLLGVKIDSQLNFKNHLETIIKKASRKVHVLDRITPYMCISNRKLLMNAFLRLSLATVHYYGCAIVVRGITKLIDYTKDALRLFIMIKRRLLQIY